MATTAYGKKLAVGGSMVLAVLGVCMAFGMAPVRAASCVDGDKATDFVGTIVSSDTMTVETKNGGKLCADVAVNFSSFKLPLTYNGNGFSNNPTAIPQYIYANKTVTLKKGTNGQTTQTIAVPDACTPYQIDAYLGEVRTSIETSEGLKGKRIVGQIFDRTKTDCSVPKVTVCDTHTGGIVTIDKETAEANKDRYVDQNSDKCKVKACNTNTGLYEMVQKGTENTSPYSTDFTKCKVKTCDTSSGTIVKVDKGQENTPPYSTNLDKCEKVTVCNTVTGETATITKDEASGANYTTDTSQCDEVTVCNTATGKVVTLTRHDAQAAKYVDKDSEKCREVTEVPSTGPVEIVSGIAGIGSVAGASSMYLRSRRQLHRL